MSQGQQIHVQLSIPNRGARLPSSIPFNRDTIVQVQIQPSLVGTPDMVVFSISGNSASNGDVVVVAGGQLQASGMVTIRGTAQTQPGSSGNLQLVARLKGQQLAASPGFSVCAHPCGVANGPHHVPYQINPGSIADGVVGMEVKIVIISDSGNIADLDEVAEREIVSDTHSRSPSMNGFPKGAIKVQKKLQPVLHVDLDWHTIIV